jgi:uncharacterized membrane protein YjjP (DUF1212 family)
MLGLLDRSTQLTDKKGEAPSAEPLTCGAALKTTALAATLLFAHGQTTERTITVAERLGRALGVAVKVLPYWGELIVEIDGAAVFQIVPAKPGVDMGRVLAVTRVVDQVCDGTLPAEIARSALMSAGRLPPASTPRFTLFAAIGAASLGIIYGALDVTSLLLIVASATIGALARRGLSGFSTNPLIQPLCAAFIAGVVAAVAGRLQTSNAITLVALCPCMVLVPGPHILNGAIDLARTRIALGIARLTYAAVIVILISAGLLFGFAAVGTNLPIGEPSPPVPLVMDVIAAGCAVASFGTFFSMPWRLLAFPIAAGMLAHAARWALITVAGGSAVTGALVACMLVSVIATPLVDRLRLPFAALAFSAVVSMIPGFFLFNAAAGVVELVSIGPSAPVALLTSIATSCATAFLIIMAMTFGLILPRTLFEHVLPPSV